MEPQAAKPGPDGSGPDRSQEVVIAFLSDPQAHGGAAVERVETHAAIVFLAGDRALKLKRAVRYPYLDFSTVERRHEACLAELALNRRTAPTLYRGVEPVVRHPDGGLSLGGLLLGGAGEILDWVVLMRRFSEVALFDRMAQAGSLTAAPMEELAAVVAGFHAAAEVRRDGGGAAVMAAVAGENVEEMRGFPQLFPAERVDRLATRTTAAAERLRDLLDRRRQDGMVRHCHGDLHLRNIVLLDGRPTLFDGIEFDPALAVIDTVYDLAFLLMDLEHRGLRPLGSLVLNRYLEETDDLGGLAALPFFLSVRAAVRAKIAATAAALAGDDSAAARISEARSYLDLAIASLEPPPARMVAVGGLSGTGKTVLARAIAPHLGAAPGAVVLRSDVIRKRLCGVAPSVRLPEEAYRGEVTERVYALLAERAAAVLAAGHAVVVDAVSARPEERQALAAVAERAGVRFDGIWLEAPLPVRLARVAQRRGDASDATAEVVERQDFYECGPLDWLRVEAGRVVADVLAECRERLA